MPFNFLLPKCWIFNNGNKPFDEWFSKFISDHMTNDTITKTANSFDIVNKGGGGEFYFCSIHLIRLEVGFSKS